MYAPPGVKKFEEIDKGEPRLAEGQSLVFRKMIPYYRANLPDFCTPS